MARLEALGLAEGVNLRVVGSILGIVVFSLLGITLRTLNGVPSPQHSHPNTPIYQLPLYDQNVISKVYNLIR